MSPLYDVKDHTNHIFSESLSSCGDNGQDRDLQSASKNKCLRTVVRGLVFPSSKFRERNLRLFSQLHEISIIAIVIKAAIIKGILYYERKQSWSKAKTHWLYG